MDNKVAEVFAKRLKELRGNMSQAELAEQIDVSRGSISFYEKCERTAGIDVLSKVADYFGCSTDYLLGKTDIKNPEHDIKEIVQRTGLSEKAAEILYNRLAFTENNTLDLFSRLIESEVPPSDSAFFYEPVDDANGNDYSWNFLPNPNYSHTPVLTALIKCVSTAESDNVFINLASFFDNDHFANDKKINLMADRGLLIDTLLFSGLQKLILEFRENNNRDMKNI